MAIIRIHEHDQDSDEFKFITTTVETDLSVIEWIPLNIEKGANFKVYDGEICDANNITEDLERLEVAQSVDIYTLPALTAVIAVVVAVILVVALTPDLALPENNTQQSPNNSLTDRDNKIRIKQRIVDVCGKVESIPDVAQIETSEYVDNVEYRYGYYVVARGDVLVENVRDDDTPIESLSGASAGIYPPLKSPNNSQPETQIGDPIDREVTGVFKSNDADEQVMQAPNAENLEDGALVLGDFDMATVKVDTLIVNVYARNGMYKQEGDKESTFVNFRIGYQLLDDDKQPVGTKKYKSGRITGEDSDEKGLTIKIPLSSRSYVRWSAERLTETDFDFDGNVVDEIRLKSAFGHWAIDKDEFGNVTTIQTKRRTVTGSVDSPKLKCNATEMIYKYLGNGVFDTELRPNTNAMQSLIRVALDDKMGRRSLDEIDADGLLERSEEVIAYFGSEDACTFNYSFDTTKTSAQQMLTTIAASSFCTLWREGRYLKSWFERPQSAPAMVFTHRSKKGGSEKWKTVLHNPDKKDSVEMTYIDATTYDTETLYYPSDQSGTNPKKIDMTGIKGKNLANWHMMREYNKLTYQNTDVEFQSGAEGKFVKPQRMISVVDGSRMKTYDGEVVFTDGLMYQLSQEVEFAEGDDHYIILKGRDGQTESILCEKTDSKFMVQLLGFPSIEVYTGNDALKTEFSFGSESLLAGQLIIPKSITPNSGEYVTIKGVNYDERYYQGDNSSLVSRAVGNGFGNGFG